MRQPNEPLDPDDLTTGEPHIPEDVDEYDDTEDDDFLEDEDDEESYDPFADVDPEDEDANKPADND